MRTVALLAVLVLTGCRAHVLDDGAVTLRVVQADSDGCGLATAPGFPGTLQLTAAGHRLTGTASFLGLGVAGFYQPGTERFVLDGTEAHADLGGCRADWVQWSLDGQGTAPDRLEGGLTFVASGTVATACTCKSLLRLDGQR